MTYLLELKNQSQDRSVPVPVFSALLLGSLVAGLAGCGGDSAACLEPSAPLVGTPLAAVPAPTQGGNPWIRPVPSGDCLLLVADWKVPPGVSTPGPLQQISLLGKPPRDVLTGVPISDIEFSRDATTAIVRGPSPVAGSEVAIRAVDLRTGTARLLTDSATSDLVLLDRGVVTHITRAGMSTLTYLPFSGGAVSLGADSSWRATLDGTSGLVSHAGGLDRVEAETASRTTLRSLHDGRAARRATAVLLGRDRAHRPV